MRDVGVAGLVGGGVLRHVLKERSTNGTTLDGQEQEVLRWFVEKIVGAVSFGKGFVEGTVEWEECCEGEGRAAQDKFLKEVGKAFGREKVQWLVEEMGNVGSSTKSTVAVTKGKENVLVDKPNDKPDEYIRTWLDIDGKKNDFDEDQLREEMYGEDDYYGDEGDGGHADDYEDEDDENRETGSESDEESRRYRRSERCERRSSERGRVHSAHLEPKQDETLWTRVTEVTNNTERMIQVGIGVVAVGIGIWGLRQRRRRGVGAALFLTSK